MSKGKEFRGPRKRGFDDDGPSPYDSPRPSRSRPSFGGGGFGGPDIAPSAPSGTPVDAVVKWFKGDKGFGFVELSNGTGDAFLHIGALQNAGYETVPPGAKLKVYVGTGAKGAQVTRVLEVDTAGAAERAPAAALQRGAAGAPQSRSGNRDSGQRHGQMVRRQQGLRFRSVERWRQGCLRPHFDPRHLRRASSRRRPGGDNARCRYAERPRSLVDRPRLTFSSGFTISTARGSASRRFL